MSTMLVVVLGLLWGVVLLPGIVRDTRRSPLSTVTRFSESMRRLGDCDSRSVMIPGRGPQKMVHRPRRARLRALRQRRKQVLLQLAGVAGFGVLAALVIGGAVAWIAAVLGAAVLGGYVVLLRRAAVAQQRRRQVVALEERRRERRPRHREGHVAAASWEVARRA